MRRPAKILFTLPNFETAGSGRALFEVVRRLDRELFAPTLCVARRGGKLDVEVAAAGLEILESPFTVAPRPLLDLGRRAAVAARAFSGQGFALWHSLHYLDDYTEPLIARAAGARFLFTKKNMSWNRRSWLLRSLLSRRIAAQNRDMLRLFFGGWPLSGKTFYLPRGVDTRRFSPADELGGVAPDGERLRVGNVAHLLPVKGQDLLIEAAARLPRIELHLAGRPLDEEYHRRLVTRVEALGIADRVFFHGQVDEVPAFLRRLDVFVLSSRPRGRMEGCPVALLEAMASGLPSIAAAIPGASDLLSEPGSGILLPADDRPFLEGLVERLASLTSDRAERLRLGAAARRRVLQEFAIEQEVSRHEYLYREMLGW